MARSKKNAPVEQEEQVSLVETSEVTEEVTETVPEEVVLVGETKSIAEPVAETAAEAMMEPTAESVSDTSEQEQEAPAECPDSEKESAEVSAPDSAVEAPTQAQESGETGEPEPQPQGGGDQPEAAEDDVTKLVLSLPKAMFDQSLGSIDRLRAAISSKQSLLKQALATDSVEVSIEEDRVIFPWFTLTGQNDAAEVDAYSKLVFALAKKAITQSRVSSEEKVNPDPRQGMRLYLINLGFIGDEFKSARAVLMRNFPTGNGATSVRNTSFVFSMPEVYKK